MVDIKRSRGALLTCKTEAQLDQESSKISALTRAYGNFICAIKELKNDDLLEDLSSDVTEYQQKCSDLYHNVVCVFAVNQMIKVAKSLTLARRRLILNRVIASRRSIIDTSIVDSHFQQIFSRKTY